MPPVGPSALEAAVNELQGFAIFERTPREEILTLCRSGQIVASAHRDQIFGFGEEASYFGIVLSGAYKLSRPSFDGDEVIVHFSTPGDVVAAFIMAQENPRFPVSAVAMGPSRFLRIPRENYVSSWKKNPDLIFRIQNLLSSRMARLHDHKVFLKAPLAKKVAFLLMNIVGQTESSQEVELPIPLTRKEIADSLGASVESVIRVMSDWSKQGFIQTSDHHIKILKPEKILSYFNENPQ